MYSMLAVVAILILQGLWIFQMRRWYVADFVTHTQEAFGKAIEQEVGIRSSRIVDPQNKWYVSKPKSSMSADEIEQNKGDTLDFTALQKSGAAVSLSDLVSQISQDSYFKQGKPPVLRKVDSLFVLAMGSESVPRHRIVLCREGVLQDCFGAEELTTSSPRVITLVKPVGTAGIYSMMLIMKRPSSAVLKRMLYAVLASLTLGLLVVLVLNYQLVVIRRRTETLKRREVGINGTIHDLKSPLAGVTTMMGWLAGKAQAAETRELIQQGTEQLRALSNSVEALLASNYDGAYNIILNRTKTDLPALLQEVIDNVSLYFIQKPHHIEVVNRLADNRVPVDGRYMKTVLYNLIGNALKYSDDGVEVTVTLETPGDGKHLRLSVADTGWGIRPRYRRKLFHNYYRVPREESRQRPGYGIGLMYTAYIVHAHGGKIKVVSRENAGSTFILTIPI